MDITKLTKGNNLQIKITNLRKDVIALKELQSDLDNSRFELKVNDLRNQRLIDFPSLKMPQILAMALLSKEEELAAAEKEFEEL